jgi:shikimate kinase
VERHGRLSAPVFLFGMMGAGKSRVGRELARRLEASFVDLDDRVERMFADSIAGIFENGEPYFRACERAALKSLLAEPGFSRAAAVVATGGGIVTDPANLADIAGVGRSIYLEVDAPTLARRLVEEGERDTRPLLASAGVEQVEHRLAQVLQGRREAYAQADIVVPAGGEVQEVVAACVSALLSGRRPR